MGSKAPCKKVVAAGTPCTLAPQETPGLGFSREPETLWVRRRTWLVSLSFSPSPIEYVIDTWDTTKVFMQAAPGPPSSSHFSCCVLSQNCCSESENGTERVAVSSQKPCCTTARPQNQTALLKRRSGKGCASQHTDNPQVSRLQCNQEAPVSESFPFWLQLSRKPGLSSKATAQPRWPWYVPARTTVALMGKPRIATPPTETFFF